MGESIPPEDRRQERVAVRIPLGDVYSIEKKCVDCMKISGRIR